MNKQGDPEGSSKVSGTASLAQETTIEDQENEATLGGRKSRHSEWR